VGRARRRGTTQRQKQWLPLRILCRFHIDTYLYVCLQLSHESATDHQDTLKGLTSLPSSGDFSMMCLGPRTVHALKCAFQKCACRRFSMDLLEQIYGVQCNEQSIVRFSAKLKYFSHRVWYFHASCHLMPEVSRLNGTNVELCT
jgi:hypothetical protein